MMPHPLPTHLSDGVTAYPWPAPREGEFAERIHDGLVFSAPVGFRPLSLELRVPGPALARKAPPTGSGPAAAASPAPLIVWVHGGGWTLGGRSRRSPNLQAHWVIERLTLAGFAVALIDYRHAPDEAPVPAAVADVRSAVRWLRAHAAELGVDPTRVVLWGESAGAHLACLAASLPEADGGPVAGGPVEVQALVDWYGPVDVPDLRAWTDRVGSGAGAGLDPLRGTGWSARTFSPLTWARPGLPPVFIAHGRDDTTVPVTDSRRYRDALLGAGARVDYLEVAGGHVFEDGPVLEVLGRSVGFLRDVLGLPVLPRLDPQVAALEETMAATGRFPLLDGDDALDARARGVELRRRFYPPRPYPVASVEDREIPGPAGPLGLRIQRPPVPSDVVILYLHGGGWVIGDLDSHQGSAARLAVSTPATVVQVDYRLAPEHPFPAAYDDVVATVEWLHQHLGTLGGRRLVLAGDSAGGNLAAALALHCRDHDLPVEAVLLLYPATDWRTASTGLPASYLSAGQDTADPRLSPVRAPSHEGLPPTVIGVGALDFLVEDDLAYAYALREAGVDVRLRVFPDLGHGFFSYATVSAAADRASEQLCRDLSALVWD